MNKPLLRGIFSFPYLVAAGCALLPFLAVHGAYVLAVDSGFVIGCNPYIDSCTSISATGRHPPASFVFKGVMLPAAMLIAVFWWLNWRWLIEVGRERTRAHWMLALGGIACLGLALYVIVLGEVGDWMRLQRRIGTILFFSFTFLAQLLFAAALRHFQAAPDDAEAARVHNVGRWMLRVCLLMLAIGIGSVIIQVLSEAWHDAVEDAIEWQLAFLLQVNFALSAAFWRRSPWRLHFVARP